MSATAAVLVTSSVAAAAASAAAPASSAAPAKVSRKAGSFVMPAFLCLLSLSFYPPTLVDGGIRRPAVLRLRVYLIAAKLGFLDLASVAWL